MDKKITRRVVLGTVVAGLAVSPFLIRAFRAKNINTVGSYDHFEVPLGAVSTKLPPEEVQKAFDILQQERSRWQKFRSLSGNIVLNSMTYRERMEAPQKESVNGYITLQMKYVDTDDSASGMRCIDDFVLTYAADEISPSSWTFCVNNQGATRSRKVRLEGEEVPGVHRKGLFSLFYQTIDIPNIPNLDFTTLLPGWELSRVEDSGTPVYLLSANGTLFGEEGTLAPTFKFTEGAILEYGHKAVPTEPRVIFTREDWKMVNGFYFPKKIGFYADNDNRPLPVDWDVPNSLFIEFTSLKVVTA